MNQPNHDRAMFWRLVLLTMLIPLAYLALFVGLPTGGPVQAYASAALRETVKEATNELLTTGPTVVLGKSPRMSSGSVPTPTPTPKPQYFDGGALFQPKPSVPPYTVYYYVMAEGIPQTTCDTRRIETGVFHIRFGDWPFYQHYSTILTTNSCGNVADTWTQEAGTWYRYQWKGRKWITRNLDYDIPNPPNNHAVMFVWNPGGDANNDNLVSIDDFTLLQSTWGRCSTDPLYNETADFEKDWCIDIEDFRILDNNFGEAGEPLGKEEQ